MTSDNEAVSFNVHPLIAIEHFVGMRSILNHDLYPRTDLFITHMEASQLFDSQDYFLPRSKINNQLTEITKSDINNYQELRDLVTNAMSHFKNEIMIRKLTGGYMSQWMRFLCEAFDDMDRRRLHPDHLKIVCKLIPFYNFDSKLLKIAENCKTVEDNMLMYGRITFKNLKLIDCLKPVTKDTKDLMAYLFETQEGTLLRADLDPVLQSAVLTIMKLNQGKITLDIDTGSRRIYSENICYHVSNKIIDMGT